jgi:histidine triad (HIT) family protein
MEQECIFCKMVSKQIPVALVYEDEKTLAFLDINPIAKGHTLVITKNHYDNFLLVPEEELKGLIETIHKVSVAIVRATGAEGFNVLNNTGEVSGAVIGHVHFHVVPRLKDDGVPLGHEPRGKYESNKEIQEIGEKIRSAIPASFKEEKVEEKKEEEKPKERSAEEAYWIRRELDIG